MQLRQVQKTLRQKLTRKTEVRDETVINIVRDLIPDVWRREATKQSLDKIHDMSFDLKYEALKKEKNQPVTQELIKVTELELEPKPFRQYNITRIAVPPRYKEEIPKPPQNQNPNVPGGRRRGPNAAGAGRPPHRPRVDFVDPDDSGDKLSNHPEDEEAQSDTMSEAPRRQSTSGRGGRGGRPPGPSRPQKPPITVTTSIQPGQLE